jgi:hypothetical protein
MLIGPSGIGKDTMINRAEATLQAVESVSGVKLLGGVTFEYLQAVLAEMPRPACAFIPAPEMTAFFGKSDYQANMLTGITDLLSNKERKDITTKGAYKDRGGQAQYIYEPTLTMHAGSTVEWLHKGMPDGTLEGGFLGRFLIVIEDLGSKYIPLPKRDRSREAIEAQRQLLTAWKRGVYDLIEKVVTPREVILMPDAEDLYANWYYNRFRIFSRAVMPYANRSRDMVLRLAMLMAFSRGHDRYVEAEDMDFAICTLNGIAEKIDRVVLPPAAEAQLGQKILDMLPARMDEIFANMGMRFSIAKQVEPALEQLKKTGMVYTDPKGTIRKVSEEAPV